MADTAVYGFVPWVRSGLASLAQAAPATNFVTLNVALTVNATAAPAVAVRLHGPGQVTGIDPRAISRMEPRPGAVSFEPNYFPLIEFVTPDFPWLEKRTLIIAGTEGGFLKIFGKTTGWSQLHSTSERIFGIHGRDTPPPIG